MVPWVGLQCVIVIFPDHTRTPLHLVFARKRNFTDFDTISVFQLIVATDIMFGCSYVSPAIDIT